MRIRVLQFSSVIKTSTYFSFFLRIRIRIHISDKLIWMRIWEAQKYIDPTESDPDAYPDLQH
jgi:hypothetical protein